MKHQINTKMHIIVYLLEETFITFYTLTWVEWRKEKILTNGDKGKGPKNAIFAITSFLNGLLGDID